MIAKAANAKMIAYNIGMEVSATRQIENMKIPVFKSTKLQDVILLVLNQI